MLGTGWASQVAADYLSPSLLLSDHKDCLFWIDFQTFEAPRHGSPLRETSAVLEAAEVLRCKGTSHLPLLTLAWARDPRSPTQFSLLVLLVTAPPKDPLPWRSLAS